MLRVLAALALAGCFAPEPTTGAPCAAGVAGDARCPAPQICVAHDGVETCELVDGMPGDRDGDGVDDARDNCPDTANPDQANEEGDSAGDACDPCPPFEGVDDSDGDGVGDPCDPNPTIAGDRLVAFTGFAGALPSTWDVRGQFTSSGGEGIATSTETTSALATIASPTSARIEIRTAFRLVAITTSADNLGAVNVVEQFTAADDRGVACQLSSLVSGQQQQLRIFDLDKKLVIDTANHAAAPGFEGELRLRRNARAYTCRASNPVLELAGSAMFAPQAPRIGLRVRGASAMFHWVLVVASP